MWRWVKWPKLAALGCFFLPWLTVSCSSQQLASASGWDFAIGRVSVTDPLSQQVHVLGSSPNWWIVLAIFLCLAGAAVAFRRRPQPVTSLVTSIGAVGAVVYATSRMTVRAMAAAAARAHGPVDDAAMSMLRVEWRPGYWATIAALLIAAVLAGSSLYERATARP